MDLRRLAAFTAHWAECPPMHMAFSGFLNGLGGKKRAPQQEPVEFGDNGDNGDKRGFPKRTSMELPADMKNDKGYDAPDAKSPVFRQTIEGLGGEIHYMKRKGVL